MAGWEPCEGFRRIFTMIDLGEQEDVGVHGAPWIIDWARRHGYTISEKAFGNSTMQAISSGDGGVDDPPRPPAS